MSDLEQSLMYLRDNRVLMLSSGTLTDENYYHASNSSVASAETNWVTGQYTVNLSNSVFGGQSTVQIPVSSFLSTCYLRLQLPQIPALSSGQAMSLPNGWGFLAISKLSYIWGSSNVNQIFLSRESHIMADLMQCDTSEKATELMTLAGQPYQYITSGSNPAQPAIIVLNLPWSRTSGGSAHMALKKAYDTTLLSNSISIIIEFSNLNQFAYYNSSVTPSIFNNMFQQASLITRMGKLRNQSLSLRNQLTINKNLSYSYPFLHYQPFVTTFSAEPQGTPYTVQLSQFINADLQAITFYIVNTDDLIGGPNAYQTGVLNPLLMQIPINLQCLYNGVVLYNYPGFGESIRMFNMHDQEGSAWFSYIPLGAAGNVSGSTPQAQCPVRLDFSQYKNLTYEAAFQATQRISNQQISLQFSLEVGTNTLPAATSFTLFANYVYNSVCNASDGQTQIMMS